MDITVKIEDWKLNIRAGVIIIHNNKALFHHDINQTYYALVGGRIMIGESSEQTIKREILEEIGKEIEVTGYVGTIENFFKMKDRQYHEYLFIHFAEFVDEQDKKIQTTIKNIEGREKLQYEWIELDKISEYDIRPAVIKQVLIENKFPTHKVNIDL